MAAMTSHENAPYLSIDESFVVWKSLVFHIPSPVLWCHSDQRDLWRDTFVWLYTVHMIATWTVNTWPSSSPLTSFGHVAWFVFVSLSSVLQFSRLLKFHSFGPCEFIYICTIAKPATGPSNKFDLNSGNQNVHYSAYKYRINKNLKKEKDCLSREGNIQKRPRHHTRNIYIS